MAAVRPSRSVITPKATNISQIWFTSSQKVVMKNISLYAAETGDVVGMATRIMQNLHVHIQTAVQ